MPSESDKNPPAFANDAVFIEGAAAGLLRTSDAPNDRYRFFEAVRMSVLESLSRTSVESPTSPAIFVRSLRPREAASHFGTPTFVFDLDLRDASQWSGRLLFTAQHGTGGWAVEMPGADLGNAFNALIEASFGEDPIAVVYPQDRVISCAVEGASAGAATLRLSLPPAARDISLKDLIEVLEILRQEGLMTPAVCPPTLWKNPGKYIPSTETERLLQWCVASEMRLISGPYLPNASR